MVSIITNRLTGAAFVNCDQVLGGGCDWVLQICENITTFQRDSNVLIRQNDHGFLILQQPVTYCKNL
jgi:hypothetical protein